MLLDDIIGSSQDIDHERVNIVGARPGTMVGMGALSACVFVPFHNIHGLSPVKWLFMIKRGSSGWTRRCALAC
jgi:hypothetical protein